MNPCLIVEALSDSTRDYDLGLKFEMYQDIPSFRDYLAIEPDLVCVHHSRLEEYDRWNHRELRSLEDAVEFSASTGGVSLAAVYRGIEIDSFDPTQSYG